MVGNSCFAHWGDVQVITFKLLSSGCLSKKDCEEGLSSRARGSNPFTYRKYKQYKKIKL